MKKHFFYCMAMAILLSSCAGEAGNGEATSGTDSNSKVGSKELPEPKTPLEKTAQDYCDCAENIDWASVDLTNPDDPNLMNATQNIMECSMKASEKHGLPIITINDSNDSLRKEMILRCPEMMKKCDKISEIMSAKFQGN